MLSEISQRDRQILYDLTYIRNFKTKKQFENQAHRNTEQTGCYQRWGVGEMDKGAER